MRMTSSRRLALVAAAALCAAPTTAMAAPSVSTPSARYSPMVTLSLLGSGVSAAALCGAAAVSAAQANPGGCVLPALDAPPPAPLVTPPPISTSAPPQLPASTSFLLPLIGGLAALVGVLALIGFGKDNPSGSGTELPPITPQ